MYVMVPYGSLDEVEELAAPATQIVVQPPQSALPVVGVLIAFTTSLVLIASLMSRGAV